MNYVKQIIEIISLIEKEETENIKKVANIMARAVKEGNSVYTFGASHASILTQELFYRAGGLAIFNPIFGKEIVLDNYPVTHTSKMEMLEGYGTLIAQKTRFNRGDVVIIHSVSGRNPTAIDMALEAKSEGVKVVGITNLAYSKSVTSRSSTGKKLYEIADVVIDNHGCIGDACVEIEGVAQKLAPTSSVIGCLIANLISLEVAKELKSSGVDLLPIFYSANLDGGSEQNERILEKYKAQIHYM